MKIDANDGAASSPQPPPHVSPTPVKSAGSLLLPICKGMAAGLGGAVVIAGGFVLLEARIGGTHGGTRSCKLKWEQRQQEIQQTITGQQSDDSKKIT